jgi:hypothetical protein
MIAAWVGVTAAVSWRRQGSAAARLGIAVFCATAASIGWALRPDTNVFDGEHVLAFVIGIASTHEPLRAGVARMLREWLRVAGEAAEAATARRRHPASLFGDAEG